MLLRTIRPTGVVAEQRKQLARDLLTDIKTFDRQLTDLDKRLDLALLEHGTTLTELDGVGVILAARVLAHTGPISRFASPAHYASYAGVAPVEVASGQTSRHRLSRAGNRQLNCAIHLIALQQVRHNRGGGRVYYERKIAEGKTTREAMRCLKRRVANRLHRVLTQDHRRKLTGILEPAT